MEPTTSSEAVQLSQRREAGRGGRRRDAPRFVRNSFRRLIISHSRRNSAVGPRAARDERGRGGASGSRRPDIIRTKSFSAKGRGQRQHGAPWRVRRRRREPPFANGGRGGGEPPARSTHGLPTACSLPSAHLASGSRHRAGSPRVQDVALAARLQSTYSLITSDKQGRIC